MLINITVNGEARSFPSPLSLAQLMQTILPGQHRGIAVAVNGTVVPGSFWLQHQLQDRDQVLIVHAVQGG